MRIPVVLEGEEVRRLMWAATYEIRPLKMEAEVLLCRALGLEPIRPLPIEEGPAPETPSGPITIWVWLGDEERQRLIGSAIRERRPVNLQAKVLLRRMLGLEEPGAGDVPASVGPEEAEPESLLSH